MRESQEWWPADFGHYGPLFIRMAWHSAGTYRTMDGRGGASGGTQRFAPLNSWPDNANLDKARRLLWPIKKKYGDAISWADLMILAGNVALESMGFKTFGFGGGREDLWGPEEDIYWGPESQWLGDKRHESGELDAPLAADHMGLIYVNPEGPGGVPDALGAAQQIRESFRRMGMNDGETVALIAGGHSFGKNHGAADPAKYLGPEPEAAPLEEAGLGWKNSYGSGKGADTITSGLEGAWTPTPIRWDNSFLRLLFAYEWTLVKSPAGAWQWEAVNPAPEDMAPDAHDQAKKQKPIMLTTDLALKVDPEYAKIARGFLENPEKFAKAFAHAWFKLTHRDMGPKSRYLGPEVPEADLIWQDPLPKAEGTPIGEADIAELKKALLASPLEIADLVWIAWASASTYRHSDKRGGANGARIRLEPQRAWEANEPQRLEAVLKEIEAIRRRHNDIYDKKVSMADLIVLAGCAGVEEAARRAGVEITVPFRPGRTDATQEMTDIEGFSWLEPRADAFRNYLSDDCTERPEELMLDKAQQLRLTAPEMAVLLAGMRAIGTNHAHSETGCFGETTGALRPDFFVTLTDMRLQWRPDSDTTFSATDPSGKSYHASRVDLVFASNSRLRAISECYAQDDKHERFVHDFISAWVKVMELDRFDLQA